MRTFKWALIPTIPFTLVIDHKTLLWLQTMNDTATPSNRQLMRWALEMQMYGPHFLLYRPGVDNGGADALSRLTATLRDEAGVQVLCIEGTTLQAARRLDPEEVAAIEWTHDFAWPMGGKKPLPTELGEFYGC